MTLLSEYNADTMVGLVHSEHDPQLDAIVFKDIDPRAFNRLSRKIQDIEKAAYQKGKSDLANEIRKKLDVGL